MKIGLLHYSMPPAIGGVERVIAAHVRLFREDGHEAVLFCDERQMQRDAEFQAVKLPMEDGPAMKEIILAEGLDVLFVHNVFTMPFRPAATKACHELAATKLRVISWVHDLAAVNPHYQVAADDLLRRHPAGAEVVAVSAERAADYLKLTGFAGVKVVPNGVDAYPAGHGQRWNGGKEDLRNRFPILFHPTRILRRKNISLGIRLIAELKKLGCSPRLLVSGAPEPFSKDQPVYRSELDALIAQLDVSQEIIFSGDETSLTDGEVGACYELADALFFPSEQEGFGLPVLEAGARRLPLFVSQGQPLAELAAIHGVVFSHEVEPAQLAVQIVDFLKHDPASHVRQLIRRDFDWQGVYRKHILPLLENSSS